MRRSRPKKVRTYSYQIEGYDSKGKFSCSESYVIEANSFDDAVRKLKKHMKEKNETRRREGICEYSEITYIELRDFSREPE